jgi:phage terminase small subunit
MHEKAPKGLNYAGQQFWKSVVAEYELFPHERKLLEAACQCWDRIVECRAAIKEHGTTYIDRYNQPRERPEAVAERQNKVLFTRLVREIGLTIAAADESRPPRMYGR